MSPLEPLTRLLPLSLRRLAVTRFPPSHRLADLLHLDVGEFGQVRLGTRYYYRPFTVTKRDGRERRLLAPSPALKALQRRLLDGYLARLPVSGHATGFRKGFSIVHNARVHARNRLIATVDLRDFFESTRANRVRAFFVRQGWHDEELRTLMRLCTYRDGLPQGAPTSPCLSNLVNVPLDDRLGRLAREARAAYSRYGDDLTFSWDADRVPDGFTVAVEECLHAAGYEIQPCKGWNVSPISSRPCVTGLELRGEGQVSLPRRLRWRKWWLWWRSWWSAEGDVSAQLQGYKGYARMVK